MASEEPIESLTLSNNEEKEIDPQEFLRTRIFEYHHIEPNDLPRLGAFLENGSDIRCESEQPLEIFQNIAIAFCKREMNGAEFAKKVRDLKEIPSEFLNDLRTLTAGKIKGKLKLMETDDPCDLLLIGAEGAPSCQRYNGDSNSNKCLLHIKMNGEVKGLALKNENNETVARCLMRLMIDEEKKTSVIFLESLYARGEIDIISEWMINFAKQKSIKMKISLLSCKMGQGELYAGEISHLRGGYAPYIYTDGGGGIKEGPFKITQCHILGQEIVNDEVN